MKVERFGVYLRVANLDRSWAFYEPCSAGSPYVSNAQIVGFDMAGALLALYASPAEQVVRGRNVVPLHPRAKRGCTSSRGSRRSTCSCSTIESIVEGPLKLFRFADPDGNALELFSLNA